MGKDWDRLGDDAVSRSWDTRGRGDNQPARDSSSPRGRHATTFRSQNPRCRKCGRAMQGQSTAKGFKVCECVAPDPYLPAVLPQRMQEWHQAWATEALRVLKPGGPPVGVRILRPAWRGMRWRLRASWACSTSGSYLRKRRTWPIVV